MTGDSCRFVEDYLERFEIGGKSIDHDAISEHVRVCSGCHDRLSSFFRVLEIPESGFLQETLDDLTLSIYNLAKSLMRQPTVDSEKSTEAHDNVLFVHQPEAPERYVAEGVEIAEEVQDFTGKDEFRGESLEALRDALLQSRKDEQLLIDLLNRGIELAGRYSWDCHNLKGILLLSTNDLPAAEREFRAVIVAPAADAYLRKVQVHSMSNLSFLCNTKGAFDEAIRWATRARVLAEETDLDCFSPRFGLMYFQLVRSGPGDLDRAETEVRAILAATGGNETLIRALKLPQNAEIRRLYVEKGLAARIPLPLE